MGDSSRILPRSSSFRPDSTRRLLESIPLLFSSHRTVLALIWAVGFILIISWQRAAVGSLWGPPTRPIPRLRPLVFSLTDFGAVGDGVTVNTKAFEKAVSEIRRRGGGQLNVEPGRWLTAPFNLTSHMTLFLAQNAIIIGIDDESYWPLMPPLPSYGYGRERAGPRYGSLIHGQNLKDVVITGHNGTINGQGQTWWTKYQKKRLNHTRGPLVQLMWSRDIHISDVTLRDSPFWTLHPYDCQNITVRNVTILTPLSGAPNTDGIDPDSCENMLIEDSYISVGDDGIAIKSGWDQYGIAYARPSTNILIRNVIVRSMISAGVSIGSEMSGGVSNVTVENLLVWNSKRGIRIKTSPGRGGYVRQITYRNLTLENVRVGIVIKTDYNEHPDEGYDPNALPIIEDINFNGIRGQGVRIPVRIYGSQEIPVRNVTFRDMLVGITYKKKRIFQCLFVQGRVIGKIFPSPCDNLDVYDEEGRLVRQSTASQNSADVDYDS
ncbi:probable polygalacturonase [Phtheirospermum japonicum]|uniref:Probable polygalacturonase n=1 Tax=Phtheirospermum japonicum TaxID=374723 RepID=A0A830C220_9LAMI|nr:probable polygalacturonase [Phtheirospermum japonicum]